jgi:hypothetical protein
MEPRQVKKSVLPFHADSHAGSAVRDYQGNFIATQTTCLPYVASLAMVEAIAMRECLSLATNLECNNVISESYSTETIQACTGKQSWWNEYVAIFADCIDLVSEIGNVSFKLCPRRANHVAL